MFNDRLTRRYFETGCFCLLDGVIPIQGSDVSDAEAVEFYIENCKCTRNIKERSPTLIPQ